MDRIVKLVTRDNRFFYGWVIVAVMAVTSGVSIAMGSLNFGLFIKPMGEELGIGRASFGWSSTARSTTGAMTAPFIGRLLDKYGSRWILTVAACITGVCMLGLARSETPVHVISIFGVMGLVGMSGPGSLVTSVPPTRWFVEGRGKALAFASAGISAGAIIFVPLTQFLIETYSWQEAWVILGFVGMGVIVPLSLLFLRREPEDIGLLPDGIDPVNKSIRKKTTEIIERIPLEKSWTRNQAMTTTSMWTLTAAFSVLSLGILTLALHRIPAFMDRGLDPGLVSLATSFDAVCAGLGSFGAGMLVKKIPVRIIGTSSFLILALASVMSIYAYGFWLMFWSMALFGLGIGTNMFNQNYIWAEYFGRDNLGSIRGIVMPINLFIGGLGAPIAGYVLDSTGSYDPAWWSGVVLMLAGAFLFFVSKNPGEPQVD